MGRWTAWLVLTLVGSGCSPDNAGNSIRDSGGATADGGNVVDTGPASTIDAAVRDAATLGSLDAGEVGGDASLVHVDDARVLDAATVGRFDAGDAAVKRPWTAGYAVTADALLLFEPSTSKSDCQGPSPCGLNADGKLIRQDLATGASTTLVADRIIDAPVPAVASTDRVLFASRGLYSIAIGGGPVSLVDATYDPRYGLVSGGDSSYYVATPIPGPTTGLMRVRAGGAPELFLTLPPTLFFSGKLAASSEYIYVNALCAIEHGTWTEVAGCPQAGVYRAPLTTGTPEFVVALPVATPNVMAIAVNDATLVWAAYDRVLFESPTLVYASANTPGASASPLFTSAEGFSGLALDATHVYVCTYDLSQPAVGHLHQITLATGEARILANDRCSAPQRMGDKLWRITSAGTVQALTLDH